MRVLLTDRFVARAPATEGQVDYIDTKVPGLTLRVGKRQRTWCLLHAQRRQTLGQYPAMPLAAARATAIAIRAGEPIAPPSSLAAVFEEYMRREGASLRTADERRAVFLRHILPTFGARPISEIKRSEITALLDRIEDRSGPRAATTVLAYLSKLFNWHAARDDEFRSPVVRGMTRSNGNERDRVLTDDEIRAIWSAGEAVPPLAAGSNAGSIAGSIDAPALGSIAPTGSIASPFNRYVRFLLLTATRRNEAADATGAEIVDGVWTIPAARYKTGVDHVIPLSPAAIALITPPIDASYMGVTYSPTAGRLFEFGSVARHTATLRATTGTTGWTLHDLRRTARSLMSRAGVAPDIAERCLGHVIGGIRRVYDRFEYLEEKRRAFEALADLVEGIVRPGPTAAEGVQASTRGTVAAAEGVRAPPHACVNLPPPSGCGEDRLGKATPLAYRVP
jgi:integrase